MRAPSPADQDLSPAVLRHAFGSFPTGVVAVAAQVDGALTGLAASSFTTVSLEPALVSFSIAAQSRTWPDLRRADHLGVTVLADHHGPLARQLAGAAGQRFADVGVSITDRGAVTVDDGLAGFDTTIHGEIPAGDHVIVLLRLHAILGAETGLDRGPLLFHRSGFGRLA
ncbi:flavin reductase family protein [Aeromicrobium endophyticum]|uniref:Flavin reductase n=1 Tax=Aeromicrobium endophyticum TaxID=2292704 RepID=A0A371P655_9ACTN|nr:flavin reductase family protein [Aeromicrobium endophyticum]REK70966.1 flavin reductase [Aeromicrobium endophyticum]